MPFEFINNNDLVDDDTRKRIRGHAALGRNKGKRVSRPSRKSVSMTARTLFRIPMIVKGASVTPKESCNIERPIDDGLILPGILPEESKGLVKKVTAFMNAIKFSPDVSNGLDYAGLGSPLCVHYMFVDEACFHGVMATALLHLNNLISRPEGLLEARRHISHTFRLVQQKLSGPGAVADETIAVIVSMTQCEHFQHRYQEGSVHVQGLLRIAQLRGGLLQLIASGSGLAQKVLRVDLENSLQLGSPTVFSLDEALVGCKTATPFPSLHVRSESEKHSLAPTHGQSQVLPASLRNILVDMLFLASMLNNAIAGVLPKINAADFYDDIISLGYRLLNVKPLSSTDGICSLQNKVHLGLTAFLVTFLQDWDGQIVRNDLLSSVLLAEVQQPLSSEQDIQEILVWLLFIGSASSCLWKHPAWVLTTRRTLLGLGVSSWENIKSILSRFPWVDVVHDTAGQALWYASNG
ncbi:hypothetical protein BDV24DRAFT_129712 [Aspergillus arachidicola]|uniref:Tachykinin family protein n=1 Tax=Aspergillus arachidicola TaxID=656916 RepID=A0A5N6YHY2_9EURO|nr:hypothetical protein BDV24DRAFT_129712 [Aspergillus arachidicola]